MIAYVKCSRCGAHGKRNAATIVIENEACRLCGGTLTCIGSAKRLAMADKTWGTEA